MDYIRDIVNFFGLLYADAVGVRGVLLSILGIFSIHKTFYFIVGMFFTRKFKETDVYHKYAIMIPARNEEAVIANLIHSIQKQDYPKELITIFVIADNCTDNTAKVARENGAICYERFNDRDRTKGFALQFLMKNIERDYGIDSFEGYFIFDADNLLRQDYIKRMNESFDAGEKIITSYRNTKNFDENWLASTYALHWLRSIRVRHRARSVLRLATNIQGTGFLFANELVRDGWNYTSLTEDRAFTADAVVKGYMISYNDAAVFYDEQPTSVRIAFRQRIRWSKGHQMAFLESGGKLLVHIITGVKKKNQTLWDQIRYRFASFDTLSQLIPYPVIRISIWLVISFWLYSCQAYLFGFPNSSIFSHGGNVAKFLRSVFGDIYVGQLPGVRAMALGAVLCIFWRICNVLWTDIKNIPIAAYVFFMERKRIKKIALHKKALYCLTWPVFDIFYRYSMYLAVFMKVTWKTIPHTSAVTIDDIEKEEPS